MSNKTIRFKIYKDNKLITAEVFDKDIIKIGKITSATLYLPDQNASRMHALVDRDAGGNYRYCDLGSDRGSKLNGVKTTLLWHPIKDGDVIEIASLTIHVGIP